jgi:mitochondrial fission protein ELM1
MSHTEPTAESVAAALALYAGRHQAGIILVMGVRILQPRLPRDRFESLPIPKGNAVRVHDEKNLAAIRKLPCRLCGALPPSHAHHVKSRGSGGSDRNVVPLCWRHHREVHDGKVKL